MQKPRRNRMDRVASPPSTLWSTLAAVAVLTVAPWARAADSLAAAAEVPQALSDRFTHIWQYDGWQGSASKSGPGSSLEATQGFRGQLTQLIRDYGVRSVLDLACGDFFWMQHVDMAGATYTGADIVAPMVEQLQRDYGTQDGTRRFVCKDATRDPLPKADLVIARDVIGHLSWAHGQALIDNARASGATWFLSTYFTGERDNVEIHDGDWRPVNLALAPYNLGAPVAVLHEHCMEGNGIYADKELGLWRLEADQR